MYGDGPRRLKKLPFCRSGATVHAEKTMTPPGARDHANQCSHQRQEVMLARIQSLIPPVVRIFELILCALCLALSFSSSCLSFMCIFTMSLFMPMSKLRHTFLLMLMCRYRCWCRFSSRFMLMFVNVFVRVHVQVHVHVRVNLVITFSKCGTWHLL